MSKKRIIMQDIKVIRKHNPSPIKVGRGLLRTLFSIQRQSIALVLAVLLILGNAQAFIAFEAHVVDVKAKVAKVDPPVMLPAGGIFSDPIDVIIDAYDDDATHVFYELAIGLDAGAVPEPVCGGLGGVKPVGPIHIADDTVIKAIACDGDSPSAHRSGVVTEFYDLPQLYATIRGYKYHDLDRSGTLTDGDFALAGWRVHLATTTFGISTVTNAKGYYSFTGLLPDTYIIEEEARAGWEEITPGDFPILINGNEVALVNFFNYDTGYECVPKDVDFPDGLSVQAGGEETEKNDDVALAANVEINGSARSNDDIERISLAANVNINGHATSSDQVDSGINVTGTVTEGAPTASLPDIMIPEWTSRAKDGGTVNGSFIFPSNTVGLTLGPTEILGDLIFGSSNSVEFAGPVYVHGDLTIGSNTSITQASAFGDRFLPIIVDGEIEIDSNVGFTGSGSIGAFLLVSTHEAIDGDDAAVLATTNNSDLGDVVLYASAGDIHIEANRTILGAFATHGTGIDTDDNAAVRLDANVTVNYREYPKTISCGERQPYESTSHILINEFVPNVIGSDQGTAGGDLDGEWVELFNPTALDINVADYVLYDSDDTHELEISGANTDTGDTTVISGGFLVVYREGDADFALNNSGGDTVRLFSDAIGLGGTLVDSRSYGVSAPEGKSFARIPDGASNWIDPEPSPGQANSYFFVPIDANDASFAPAAKPPLDTEAPYYSTAPKPPPPPTAVEQVSSEPQAKLKEDEPNEIEIVEPNADEGPDGPTDNELATEIEAESEDEPEDIVEAGPKAESVNEEVEETSVVEESEEETIEEAVKPEEVEATTEASDIPVASEPEEVREAPGEVAEEVSGAEAPVETIPAQGQMPDEDVTELADNAEVLEETIPAQVSSPEEEANEAAEGAEEAELVAEKSTEPLLDETDVDEELEIKDEDNLEIQNE
jgi:hypothetical protein